MPKCFEDPFSPSLPGEPQNIPWEIPFYRDLDHCKDAEHIALFFDGWRIGGSQEEQNCGCHSIHVHLNPPSGRLCDEMCQYT